MSQDRKGLPPQPSREIEDVQLRFDASAKSVIIPFEPGRQGSRVGRRFALAGSLRSARLSPSASHYYHRSLSFIFGSYMYYSTNEIRQSTERELLIAPRSNNLCHRRSSRRRLTRGLAGVLGAQYRFACRCRRKHESDPNPWSSL